jgi:hypothetical protein
MNPTETNPLHAIIALASAKISTLPTLPFDLIVKVALHYIQENPEKILESYHYIQNHISKKEKQSLILECFEKIYEEFIDEEYDEQWDSEPLPFYEMDEEMEETETEKKEREEKQKKERNEIIERNERKEYSKSLVDLVIYKSRKNEQILKNFSAMIFEIRDFLGEKELREKIVSPYSIRILPFEKHNLFSLEMMKILYENEEKNIFVFLMACSASNVEIIEYLFEKEPYIKANFHKFFYELYSFVEAYEDLELLEFLCSHGFVLRKEHYRTQSLKCFEWLYSKNCEWSSEIILYNEEFIAFVEEKGLPFKRHSEAFKEIEEIEEIEWNTPFVVQEMDENPW